MGMFLPVTPPKVIYNSNTRKIHQPPLLTDWKTNSSSFSPNPSHFQSKVLFPCFSFVKFSPINLPHSVSLKHTKYNPCPHFWSTTSLQWLASSSETLVPTRTSSAGLSWSHACFHGSSVCHSDHTPLVSYVPVSCSRSICLMMSSLPWIQLELLEDGGLCAAILKSLPYWTQCLNMVGTQYLSRTQHILPQICLNQNPQSTA